MTVDYRYYPSYLAFYQQTISQPLAAIDAFIKSEQTFTAGIVSALLGISKREVFKLVREQRITHWDTGTFLKVMTLGSSHVCQFYKREVETGYLEDYAPKDIAYIYNLDLQWVSNIFEQMALSTVKGHEIADVLAYTIS